MRFPSAVNSNITLIARLVGLVRAERISPPAAKADKRARSAKAPKISPGFKPGRLPPDR
jgi:hypothetical protein